MAVKTTRVRAVSSCGFNCFTERSGPLVRLLFVYERTRTYKYIHIEAPTVLPTSVGLAQARPNYCLVCLMLHIFTY